MNLPNILTITRLVLAPFFFVLISLPEWLDVNPRPVFVFLAALFAYIELTDVVDGYLARRTNQVTELGKLLDPFSDVICRISYFLAFVVRDIMPPLAFLIILYREFGIVFIRMILSGRGIALAARRGGKIKSLFYFFSSVAGLMLIALSWFNLRLSQAAAQAVEYSAVAIFWVAASLALVSFADYMVVFLKIIRGSRESN